MVSRCPVVFVRVCDCGASLTHSTPGVQQGAVQPHISSLVRLLVLRCSLGLKHALSVTPLPLPMLLLLLLTTTGPGGRLQRLL